MKTKNAKAITRAEREYLTWVKEQPCVVCGAGAPSDAHHIEQGKHFLAIPLCKDCHQGSHNGIHGRRAIWNVMKRTELDCVGTLVQQLFERGLLAVKN